MKKRKLIRFSSRKLDKFIQFPVFFWDKIYKNKIFDFFNSKEAKEICMNKELAYHYPAKKYTKNTLNIPFVLYKTGEITENKLHNDIKKLFIETIKQNPGLQIEYYDNNQRLEFIKKNFNKEVVFAYKSLTPGAFRADLFRYCILYIKGGIYGDLTQTYHIPLTKFIDLEKDELVIVRDYKNENQTTNGLLNGFIASTKGNPIFKTVIDYIVQKVNTKDYGINSLDISGPYAFRRALQTYKGQYRLELELDPFDYKSIRNIRTGKKILVTKLPNHNELIGKNKKTNYHEIWLRGEVYRDILD